MKDWFKADAIPQNEVMCGADVFENEIKAAGVGFACEWFGHERDGHFAKETVNALCERAEINNPYELKNGKYELLQD
jgi:hypothetical protein